MAKSLFSTTLRLFRPGYINFFGSLSRISQNYNSEGASISFTVALTEEDSEHINEVVEDMQEQAEQAVWKALTKGTSKRNIKKVK